MAPFSSPPPKLISFGTVPGLFWGRLVNGRAIDGTWTWTNQGGGSGEEITNRYKLFNGQNFHTDSLDIEVIIFVAPQNSHSIFHLLHRWTWNTRVMRPRPNHWSTPFNIIKWSNASSQPFTLIIFYPRECAIDLSQLEVVKRRQGNVNREHLPCSRGDPKPCLIARVAGIEGKPLKY